MCGGSQSIPSGQCSGMSPSSLSTRNADDIHSPADRVSACDSLFMRSPSARGVPSRVLFVGAMDLTHRVIHGNSEQKLVLVRLMRRWWNTSALTAKRFVSSLASVDGEEETSQIISFCCRYKELQPSNSLGSSALPALKSSPLLICLGISAETGKTEGRKPL